MIMNQYKDYALATEQEFLDGLQCQDLREGYPSSGIPLKYRDGNVYTDVSDSHTLIFGSTGTKKTRNFCIPGVYTLGMAGESMVISDPKGEIYRSTSGFLENQGYEINVINLRNPEYSARWNPLTLPYQYYKAGDKDRAIEMVSDFAVQLKSQVHTERDLFWENQAMDLLIGLVLILFECESNDKKIHMESVWQIRMGVKLEREEDAESKVFWDFLQDFPKDSMIHYKLESIYSLRHTEKTFSCIISTFDAMLQVFLFNKKVMWMLNFTEIKFDGFGEKKTALYLIIQDEKTTLHFLVSVFIKQCYEFLIERAQAYTGGALPLRLNFILDEFSNFPRIADMPAMISAARSRNIRFLLVVQSKQQLQAMYGKDAETIKSNCRNWIYLPCRELELLREIRELCGEVYESGKGNTPLLNIPRLQSLKIGWEDSQALVLRANARPYITWVKDFEVYPQAQYEDIPFVKRDLEAAPIFTVEGYLRGEELDEHELDDMLNKALDDILEGL